ncbi:MAG: HD domain-containing protein [Pseudobutyrivibrio sp.]|nr:HD domain-containing protein [Pseudobutyrivibrio sp.]
MKRISGRLLCAISVCVGVALNVSLAYLTYELNLPFYLDTIGTIGVAAIGGIFPGFLTAMLTNVLCGLFNQFAAYYSILSLLIAAVTSYLFNYRLNKQKKWVVLYLAILAFIGGGLGSVLQLALLGHPQFQELIDSTNYLVSVTGVNYYVCFVVLNLLLNLLDKGTCTAIAMFIVYIVPEPVKERIISNGWRQRPLTDKELKAFEYNPKDGKRRRKMLQTKVTMLLVTAAVSMTIIMALISVRLYYNTSKLECTNSAEGAVRLAAREVDPEKIDMFLKKGRDAEGYQETEEALAAIRKNIVDVEYLYVLKIERDGCHFIFDIETGSMPAYKPGEVVPFEPAFYPYLNDLYEGKEIAPIESKDISGWVLSKYYPIRDKKGNTVAYVGADVSMNYLSDYATNYFWRAAVIFSGFLLLIIAYGMFKARYNLIHPINSMAAMADSFIYDADNQAIMQDNVKRLKSLEIATHDEVENLYRNMCKMTEDAVNKMNDIRHQAKRINQMQEGLIITMADMVESRDSDTGYHILKTADYVEIILEGLVKKGYYKEKLTPKYIEDVKMSAPLHDIGKINIPDSVLNKPGKLTDEEYEIMKRHTTEGKKLMEKAISTVQGENYLKEARNMAAYHHEKWDGTGYPEGLKGAVIPLSARIMAVADVFDALTAKRVYKDPMPFEKAMSIITEGAGKHFDPKCVEVFVDAEKEVRRVLRKYQD